MAVRRRETVRHRRSTLQQRARPKSELYGSASNEIPALTRRSAISGNDNNLICLILSPVINDNATPGMKLPGLAIAPVHRADGSGTTFVFTSYLSAVSPEWNSKVGANASVNWPAGAGAKGNDGVAATTHNTRGRIGYVENAYATQNHLITTQLRNKAGKFIEPTMASFSAAAANGDWANAKNYAVDLIDQPGDTSWPIVSAMFILLPKDPKDRRGTPT
jgi:phosphate ABC transporter phosphate-binding protein